MRKPGLLKVQLRGGFSDRNGINPVNTEIQLTQFDERTRIALVNAIDLLWAIYIEDIDNRLKESGQYKAMQRRTYIIRNILENVYTQKIDHGEQYTNKRVMKETVYETITYNVYNEVLDVLGYTVQLFYDIYINKKNYFGDKNPYDHMNYVFEKEYVGYRFVNKLIVPITNEIEIDEICDATKSPYAQVNNHLDKSLGLLSNRENPDYCNSIKESISAVECICNIIIGEPTKLGTALKKLEDTGLVIHPALKSVFDKLYGYTSDAAGIRHAGQLGGSDSTFEEAKFMLVSCCAFVNYLIGNMSKLNN